MQERSEVFCRASRRIAWCLTGLIASERPYSHVLDSGNSFRDLIEPAYTLLIGDTD